MLEGDRVILERCVPVGLRRVARVARLGAEGEIGETILLDQLHLLLKPRKVMIGLNPGVHKSESDHRNADENE